MNNQGLYGSKLDKKLLNSSKNNTSAISTRLLNNNESTAHIESIEFSIFKPEDIDKLSHVHVKYRNLYRFNTQIPYPLGCLDPRLGVSNKRDVCKTCGEDLAHCVGHFGHLVLELPVFHIGFFKEIMRVLQAICKHCSRVLVDPKLRREFIENMKITDENRGGQTTRLHTKYFRKTILEHVKKQKFCPYCKKKNGSIKKIATAFRIIHEYKDKTAKILENEEIEKKFDWVMNHASKDLRVKLFAHKIANFLNPLKVYELFKNIPIDDYILLNFGSNITRPQDMIITKLPIPPICVRPSVQMGFSGSNEDDLTIKLGEITHCNTNIRNAFDKGATVSSIIENWEYLQQLIAMYINSDLPGYPRSIGTKPIRALAQRLKGKMGRFRGNLSGKRVDFSARTVISPDPNLRIDQVGVPIKIAKTLTYPERVTKFNISRLKQAVLNGCNKHPGANFVEFATGHRFYLLYCNRENVAKRLNIGDIVERHVIDGEIVLFNRQPSLHRMSIMAHRAKILKGKTFRFNECICTPFNADFDGDEMNLHLPQTEEARAEAQLLMSVKENMVSPRHGTPLISATQDFLTASYLLTRKDVFYDHIKFCSIITFMNDGLVDIELPKPSIIKPCKLWTGKQIFTVLIRSNSTPHNNVTVQAINKKEWPYLSIELPAANYDLNNQINTHPCMDINDGYVIIRNSILHCGNLCKKSLGGGRRGIIFNLLRDYNSNLAAECLNKLAKLSARWITNVGFSIGINDVTPSKALQLLKDKLIFNKYQKCQQAIKNYDLNQFELTAGNNRQESLEGYLLKQLNDIRGQAGSVCLKELDFLNNPPLIMAMCGAKGSKINISQMIACVGQQAVGGKRISNGFFHRTLPTYNLNSRGAAAKGFVENSFYSGLNANEFFFILWVVVKV